MREQIACPLTWPVGWPRTAKPTPSRFILTSTKNYPGPATARDAVLRELRFLKADRIQISTNMPITREGRFADNRRDPVDTGAAVYFTLKDKRQVLACDRWKTVGENLWSIAKTIEATRGIERWGSVTTEQAFAGYIALEEKTQASCWDVLGLKKEGLQLATPDGIQHAERIILTAWREKAMIAHPDKGGTSEALAEVNAAKDMALQLIKQ